MAEIRLFDLIQRASIDCKTEKVFVFFHVRRTVIYILPPVDPLNPKYTDLSSNHYAATIAQRQCINQYHVSLVFSQLRVRHPTHCATVLRVL